MKHLLRGISMGLGLLGLLAIMPGGRAAAHNAYPARQISLTLGAFGYQALLYNEKVNAGDRVQIVLMPDSAAAAAGLVVQVAALGPAGQVVPASLRPDENNHRNTAVDVTIPTAGAWQIQVRAPGAGGGTALIPLAVAPPPAIPMWAGWAIALSPLLGVAWFAVQQRGMLRRARTAGLGV